MYQSTFKTALMCYSLYLKPKPSKLGEVLQFCYIEEFLFIQNASHFQYTIYLISEGMKCKIET